jgi:hypothetical protein
VGGLGEDLRLRRASEAPARAGAGGENLATISSWEIKSHELEFVLKFVPLFVPSSLVADVMRPPRALPATQQ